MKRIGYTGCKTSILEIFTLLIENIYLLPEKILTFTEITTLGKNEVLVKTSTFWDRIIFLIQENKIEISLTLYNVNREICKKKNLNAYQKIDLPFF